MDVKCKELVILKRSTRLNNVIHSMWFRSQSNSHKSLCMGRYTVQPDPIALLRPYIYV